MTTLAIIGTGIAGLGCAHFLHSRFDLTLYEQNDYAGGHTNTVTVEEEGRPVPIDTGFMVFNEVTYPNLTRLFRELDVETKPTSMSFSVQHLPSGLEYNGGESEPALRPAAQPVPPALLADAGADQSLQRRGGACAGRPGARGAHGRRDYVAERGYGDDLLSLFLVPMSSAVWSHPAGPDARLSRDDAAAVLAQSRFPRPAHAAPVAHGRGRREVLRGENHGAVSASVALNRAATRVARAGSKVTRDDGGWGQRPVSTK